MFRRKKLLEEKLFELEKKVFALETQTKTLQNELSLHQRRSIEQAKDFESKILKLKTHAMALEEKIATGDGPAKESQSEEKNIPMAQIMDEWLNGERKGKS